MRPPLPLPNYRRRFAALDEIAKPHELSVGGGGEDSPGMLEDSELREFVSKTVVFCAEGCIILAITQRLGKVVVPSADADTD